MRQLIDSSSSRSRLDRGTRAGRLALSLLLIALAVPSAAQVPDVAAPADVAAPPADAVTSASGLASKVITPGTGTTPPAATDFVTVHYTGWSTDGTMFDSSRTKDVPVMFPLNRALAGWRECVGLMVVGETRRCWIPQALAYRGAPGRPAGTVVFDVVLLETHPSPTIAPPDVAAIPDDAPRTASGLAYKVLRPGTTGRRPAPWNRVLVHYTGWTTDGRMFDSSVARGAPTTMALDQVIAGWTEGLQLMAEGERTRFWIPQDLAYKGEAGSPRGMLVFDIELVAIQ